MQMWTSLFGEGRFFFIIIIIHEADGVSGIFVKGLLCLCQTLTYRGPAAVQH